MESYPKISIVTPSFNQGNYIEQTILSVIEQNYPNLEYIIIDGGSTDNSVDIIKKYQNHLSYWVSEPDKGQSDAINKGLHLSSGYVFNWLGSDDFLEPNILKKIGELFLKPDTTIVTGTTIIKNEKTNSYEFFKTNIQLSLEKTIAFPCFHQPSTYILTKHAKEFGGISTKLHFAMDTELYTKYLIKNGLSGLRILDKNISNFRIHNDSKTGTVYNKFISDISSIFYSISKQNGFQNYAEKIIFICNNTIINDYEFHYNFNEISKKQIEEILVNYIYKYVLLKYSANHLTEAKYLIDGLNINLLQANDKKIARKLNWRLKLPLPILAQLNTFKSNFKSPLNF